MLSAFALLFHEPFVSVSHWSAAALIAHLLLTFRHSAPLPLGSDPGMDPDRTQSLEPIFLEAQSAHLVRLLSPFGQFLFLFSMLDFLFPQSGFFQGTLVPYIGHMSKLQLLVRFQFFPTELRGLCKVGSLAIPCQETVWPAWSTQEASRGGVACLFKSSWRTALCTQDNISCLSF